MTYARKGALNLFAGFDTRTGTVYATTAERKRQVECIAFLEHLDRDIAPTITTVHMVLDNMQDAQGETGPSLVEQASTLCLPLSPGALFLDEPGGAVVLDFATQTVADCGFC